MRGKRNVNQTPECEKPHEEYSAEADDEMEEEIKLCNKKKLMVALKDINADKKLVEGSSVKMYSLEQRDKSLVSSILVANVSTSAPKVDVVQQSSQPVVEKTAPPTESISDRHSVAVAKKTKKQKIIENDVDSVEMSVIEKRNEFKALNDRLEEPRLFESERKEKERKSEEKDSKVNNKTVNTPVEPKVDQALPPPPPPPLPEKEDEANELGSDDMEICDDTTNTTPAYEPPKFSLPPKSQYSAKLESETVAPVKQQPQLPAQKDSMENEPTKEHKTPEKEVRPSYSNTSPTKPHEKWAANERLRAESAASSSHEVKSVVVKTSESIEERTSLSPTKSSASSATTSIISPVKVQENVVKSPNVELRPNVIVDAQSETPQEPPPVSHPQHVSPVKNDQIAEEPKPKEKQISPVKLSPTIVNPKTSPTVRPNPIETTSPNKIDTPEKETSPSKHIRKTSASDLELDTDVNRTKPPTNRTELSPREKAQAQQAAASAQQLSPEKTRDSKNSVIKSVIEPPNPAPSDCAPLSGSTVSKNDETKTTTQDFCQRIDPNKTPQHPCATKSDGKVETKHEPFKMDHSSPPATAQPPTSASSSSGQMEKSMHRMQETVKTPPKDTAIIQPKEEPNRMETPTPGVNPANGNQTPAEPKNRYKQQQTSAKQSHSSGKSQTSGDHKKNTSSSCSQTSHFDIKRESKTDVKSNTGYANESTVRRESPTKRELNKQSTGYGSSMTSSSSSSSKNFSNESTAMTGSKSSMSSGSGSTQGTGGSGSDKKHGSAEKKSTSSEKKSNSAEKKAPEMRGNLDADLNKMRPQFAMNQLPNYHTAHQYYNLSPWDAYNYHSGYNLPHLDPAATQKSPTKFHKDLANSMYGGMTSNYLAANSLAAQQQQQQQQQNQQQIQSNLQYQHQQQVSGLFTGF